MFANVLSFKLLTLFCVLGEGSLEMQQDRDYTVEYDAPVQVQVNQNFEAETKNSEPATNTSDSSAKISVLQTNKNDVPLQQKPVPMPRYI